MEYRRYRIEYKSRSDVFKLYCLGDIHGGVVYCAEDKIRAKVRQIANDPFAYWVGMGDYTDCITPSDKRWDESGIAKWIDDKQNIMELQRQWCVKLFEPIKDKCLGLIEGNHEVKIRVEHHTNILKNVCDDLGVTPLGYSCFLDIDFVRKPRQIGNNVTRFRGRLTHGAGCAQTDGAITNRLKKALKDFDADFYAHAHLHRIKCEHSDPILTVNKSGKITHKLRCAAMTGCWFKTYEQGVSPSYGEIRDLPPSAIGCPVFIFVPDKGIVDVNGGREY